MAQSSSASSAHGGRRPGAGRPPRPHPKSRPIWCGQLSEDKRQFILDTLTPDERGAALITTALAKQNA